MPYNNKGLFLIATASTVGPHEPFLWDSSQQRLFHPDRCPLLWQREREYSKWHMPFEASTPKWYIPSNHISFFKVSHTVMSHFKGSRAVQFYHRTRRRGRISETGSYDSHCNCQKQFEREMELNVSCLGRLCIKYGTTIKSMIP